MLKILWKIFGVPCLNKLASCQQLSFLGFVFFFILRGF